MADTPWKQGPWKWNMDAVLGYASIDNVIGIEYLDEIGLCRIDIDTPEARLIAAAPDMAEALAECVDWLESEFEGHGDEERPEKHMLARARAALAKARGEQ